MSSEVIFISGTPCVGKTTVTNSLVDFMSSDFSKVEVLSINEFAFDNDLVLGVDEDKGYKVIDVELLDKCLNEYIDKFLECNEEGLLIVEGHLSHLCSNCMKCIVLRLNPDILRIRLEERDYSESKVNENLEAEILGVCSAEAYNIHLDKVNEIDTTDLSIDEVCVMIKDIILENETYPVGYVDFMEYLLK